MQRNFGKALAIMALTSSDGVQASYSWFGGNKEQKTTKHSMIEVENGDAEIGELIYHPNMIDVEREENVNDYNDLGNGAVTDAQIVGQDLAPQVLEGGNSTFKT